MAAILLAMPWLTVGGAEASVSRICRELKRLGFRIFVITTEPVQSFQGDTTQWFRDAAAGIYHLPQESFVFDLIRRESIGLIWQVGSAFVYDLLPQLKKRFPAIAVTDLLFNSVGHTTNYLKRRRLIDHAIVEHEGMKQWLLDHGESENRITVIPNGIDLDEYSPQPRTDTGSFVVAFIGRLSEEKAPDTFVAIAERFKNRADIKFVVLGTGPLEAEVRALADRCGLKDQLRFLGFVSTRRHLSSCDLVVVCSRVDGRPNVIMESLAMGIPVVASRVGGIPEMTPEGQGSRLCNAGDIDAFCSAVEELERDRTAYATLSAAGRRWAEQHFSIAGAGESYAALFRSAGARGPTARTEPRPSGSGPAALHDELVSIVIPCYNPSAFLRETLASIAAQTHRKIETILVNDGTNRPESLALLNEAAGQVDVYLEQENRGLAAARNTGFRAARGRFIVPLDADDLIQPTFVAECLAELDAHPDAAFVYPDFQVFGTKNYAESPGEYNLNRLLDRNFLVYASMIRTHDWEQSGGYDDSMRLGYEDWEFWLRLGARGRFGRHLPKSLFRYRKHGASLYDIALAHHQELVNYIQGRHPELYEDHARAEIRRRWAPSVCIVAGGAVVTQTLTDVQTIEPALTVSLPQQSLAPVFLLADGGNLESTSAELAVLAIWGGHDSLRLPDGSLALSRDAAAKLQDTPVLDTNSAASDPPTSRSIPVLGNLHRNLQNAGVLSWQAWAQHPVESAGRLIPLALKERINEASGRPVFDLSFYLKFQPKSLVLGNVLMEPLEYSCIPASGRTRIALVVPHLGPGGAESVLLDVVATLPRERFEVLLVATHSQDDRWRSRWIEHAEHIYDLAKVVPAKRMTGAVFSIVSNWKCDVVLVQNSLYGYSALPAIKRASPQTKTVDIIHAIDDRWDQVTSTAQVASDIDIRAAVSGAVRDRLIAAGTPPDRVRMLRSGVDLERFKSSTTRPDTAIKQILFAGRLDPVKRPLLLIDIAAELLKIRKQPNFRFVVAGDGPEMERLQRKKRDPLFDLKGQVQDLAPLYQACDVVILPSRSEGVPLVVLEALACSRPVVASRTGGIPELLDSSCGFLIDIEPGEAANFAMAINTLLNDADLRERLGRNGRAKVEVEHDLRRVRESYAAILELS